MVEYERNRGDFVTQFSSDELGQLYLARDLLETAVLPKLSVPTDDELVILVEVTEALRSAGVDDDMMMRQNDRFHVELLELSAQLLLVAEIQRIWGMSVAYRGLSLSVLSDAAAVGGGRRHDRRTPGRGGLRLADLWRSHRQVSQNRLLPVLR
ncbi:MULTISPECIES: FCD domain-containing protein [unclassified Pseudonocardia]|uniref:FCD domain-containing protein n=1 Tax=unclassified Pseudonocardia TaxID=2619320 RepID=UPI0001FFE69B|nr:FCD domain-containing protein [Pseudonocardia sp. Ae707_Ps1]OLM08955.1 hypothetical protein Ae707Ps1_5902c [Pseudonocardia sp. Ae707_Ps1]